MTYTGYKITVYIDTNPQSSTYQQQRTERVLDTTNCPTGEGNWELTSSFCELNEYNQQTGYLINIYQDTDPYSSTYGTTRRERTLDTTTCPISTETDPNWQIVEGNSYCETQDIGGGKIIYTGRYIADLIDGNILSATFGNHITSAYTEDTWPFLIPFPCVATDRTPDIEVISSACVLTLCDGVMTTNGYKEITGIDKNEYSPTFLDVVTTTVADAVNCPNNCTGGGHTYIFTWNDNTTLKSASITSAATSYTYSVISTKDSVQQGYTVTSKPSWVTGTSIGSNNALTINVSSNSSSQRSGQVVLTQNESGKQITLSVTQASGGGGGNVYVFTWGDNTTSKSESATSAATSYTYTVISTKDGASQSFSLTSNPNWATTSVNGNTVTVTVVQNDGNQRSGSVVLTQAESNNTITLSLTQEAGNIEPVYVFTYSDSTTAKTESATSALTAYSYTIISTKNGNAQAYSITTLPSWVDAYVSGDKLVISASKNRTLSARTDSIVLTQSESNLTITFSITQAAGTSHDYSQDYLTFKILSSGTINWMVTTPAASSVQPKTISYSKDSGATWTNVTSTTEGVLINANAGETIWWKGTNAKYSVDSTGFNTFSGSSAVFDVEGNIMSLISGDSFANVTTLTDGGTFRDLFRATNVVNAGNLVLPATTVARMCYEQMFRDCTSLVTAPELPATTLADYCYLSMYTGCQNLTTAPALAATTMTTACYSGMFQGCTNFVISPSLPATTLAQYCYSEMFESTNIVIAPTLPATTLASGCYGGMFVGCECLYEAPVLPASVLVDGCYSNMFLNCYNLTAITCYATDISATDCTLYWTHGVPLEGVFTKADSMNDWEIYSYHGIPAYWTINSVTPPVPPVYVFTYSDSTTAKSQSSASAATSYTYTLVSTKNGNAQSFSITTQPTWATASVNGTTLSVTLPQNDSTSSRTDSIVMTQAESNNTVTLSLSQAGSVTPPTPTGYSGQYLTFVILTGGTINWKGDSKAISYSTDSGSTWTNITATTAGTSFNVASGDVVMFKGNNASYSGTGFGTSTAYFNAEGNIMSLTDGDNFATATTFTSGYTFLHLFNTTNVVSAENLILGATTLEEGCYEYMFDECINLTTAPALPATTLAPYCYESMFFNCSGLTTAPSLPATTMADCCYQDMFAGCKGLTTAPTLPATTLAQDCYRYMFRGCTGLITGPASIGNSSTTMLGSGCCQYMFNECTSLTTAPALPATTLSDSCYWGMFNGCTGLTTAPVISATTLASKCCQRMFQGCTSLVTAPTLPATTLAENCYSQMFSGCISLTTAPVLSASTLANGCYGYMFSGCSSLNSITCLATDISANGSIRFWVYGVASSGTFTKASSMTGWSTGTSGIPNNWTVQDY